MAENLDNTIRENAVRPKQASADGVSAQQHPLRDQIKVDRYLASKEAVKKGLGVRLKKLVPPGA